MVEEKDINFVVENVSPTEDECKMVSAWIQQKKKQKDSSKSSLSKKTTKPTVKVVRA